jgi:putative DNA primase/helicase
MEKLETWLETAAPAWETSVVIEQFKTAMAARDIVPPDDLMADGCLHRCDAAGKNGKGDASYLLHLDGYPAGGFENHRDGQGWQDWRAKVEPFARQTHCAKAEAKQADNELRQCQAREKAQHILAKARHATHHPYLTQKHVPAHPGVKNSGSRLILPLQDAAGAIQSLQFIDGDGKKRFLAGGRKQGGHFLIGTPVDVLCIAEGYATAASIHEATGHAVAVAFDAGNLRPVAEALRGR